LPMMAWSLLTSPSFWTMSVPVSAFPTISVPPTFHGDGVGPLGTMTVPPSIMAWAWAGIAIVRTKRRPAKAVEKNRTPSRDALPLRHLLGLVLPPLSDSRHDALCTG